MRERPTARVLLFDEAGRILLLKGRLPNRPAHTSSWFTVGGGVEPGETLVEAALREIAEETGFVEGVELGPIVWVRQSVSALVTGEIVLFKESYIIARCRGGEPTRDGWEPYERDLIDDIRWWSLDEIAATSDRIWPERFCELIGGVARGEHPDQPLEISVERAG
ncbi:MULTISPECIES: NUDIX hydrolase [unclassified Phenylobacterium]|uniref:NUDIX hydrolase n=1 Tax=unclassified Phenylobacterium TaxID=2640670 RepID=UPI0022B580E6|nr:NUDIX domain-containing protein [Phenylobacterium sp. NIBR 498073]MBS0489866.1 NUDIX domain-containing protein [Pseudomonadota bacterium]WGU39327.1 NUDIX domain-containing protein [Phenylobacterium sp. NIBR 498073]